MEQRYLRRLICFGLRKDGRVAILLELCFELVCTCLYIGMAMSCFCWSRLNTIFTVQCPDSIP